MVRFLETESRMMGVGGLEEEEDGGVRVYGDEMQDEEHSGDRLHNSERT